MYDFCTAGFISLDCGTLVMAVTMMRMPSWITCLMMISLTVVRANGYIPITWPRVFQNHCQASGAILVDFAVVIIRSIGNTGYQVFSKSLLSIRKSWRTKIYYTKQAYTIWSVFRGQLLVQNNHFRSISHLHARSYNCCCCQLDISLLGEQVRSTFHNHADASP